jgi:putative glutamine amidotransferase
VDHAVAHEADDGKPPARHMVKIEKGSLIERLSSRTEMEVNSYHHQAIEKPGRDLRPVAFSSDGVIEAVEDTTGRFVLGVQWHPERGWKEDPFSKALFATFIDNARLRYNQ